ncbi:hypothetical protein Tco_0651137 [Tanacetum coccineum]
MKSTKIHVDNESAICVVKNPVYHFKAKHIEIRHHFIRDSYEKRSIEMVKIHNDNNVEREGCSNCGDPQTNEMSQEIRKTKEVKQLTTKKEEIQTV